MLIIFAHSEIITNQLAECPRDFFDSDLTAENFLRSCLGRFVRTVRENQADIDAVLVDAVEGLVAFVRDTFKWDLGEGGEEEEVGRGDRGEYLPVVVGAGGMEEDDEEDDEYAPVVVELEEEGDEASDGGMKLDEEEEEDDGFVEGY